MTWASKQELNKLFEYKGGVLYWRISPKPGVSAGDVAGYPVNTGYWRVTFKGTSMSRNRLVWIMHNGAIPDGVEVDHKDRVRANDKINNLSLMTSSQNNSNRGVFKNNKSGSRGVTITDSGKFKAQITVNGEVLHLGTHDTLFAASAAYEKARVANGIPESS